MKQPPMKPQLEKCDANGLILEKCCELGVGQEQREVREMGLLVNLKEE